MDCPLKRETYYIFLQCGEWKNWGKETKMISFLCTRIRRYVCEICGFFFFSFHLLIQQSSFKQKIL